MNCWVQIKKVGSDNGSMFVTRAAQSANRAVRGSKLLLPVEDNGSFASLLNAFGQPEIVPARDPRATEK